MNERIKALLYEAGGQYNGHNVLTGVERVDTENVDYEKFAELIVKECAELFDKNETDIRIPEYQIHDSIMIHFGLY